MSMLAALLTEETLFAATFAADHRVVFRVTIVAEAEEHFFLKVHKSTPLVPANSGGTHHLAHSMQLYR